MNIDVVNLTKYFGDFEALKNIDINIKQGELLSLLGPSGSGKTTLLRVIAGLEALNSNDKGEILFNSVNVANKPIKERNIGFVFQHYALFKHMSVFENIAFGLRVKPKAIRPSNQAIKDKVEKLLNLIQLDGFQHRFPWQLSGGQRQRVALARSLAVEPEVLLLDEPFGALDAKVRSDLRRWLKDLQKELGITTILVTHDQDEALEVSDRIVVINKGKIEQLGTPEDVFHNPINEFVMSFLGNVNLFHARIEDKHLESKSEKFLVRPHELEIVSKDDIDALTVAKVHYIQLAGSQAKVELLSKSGDSILIELPHYEFREKNITKESEVGIKKRETKNFFENGAGI